MSDVPREETAAWEALLRFREAETGRSLEVAGVPVRLEGRDGWAAERPLPETVARMLDLYLPYCRPGIARTTAHLGQSLDGRIATESGASQWVTGPADIRHTHRMRALSDAVIVGAGTVRADDPQLTVRHCPGRQPVRVVIDPERRLGADHRVFADGVAPTILIAAAERAGTGERHGRAEVLGVARAGSSLDAAAFKKALAARGLRRLFVEGGGVTVSAFLAQRALDRLQVTVAPVIIGSGRPGVQLPAIADLAAALRPRVRRFRLGEDTLFECIFDD